MRTGLKARSNRGRRAAKRLGDAAYFQLQNLESRVLLSTSLSSYSTLVTDIQTAGAFNSSTAIVNGAANKTSGPFQYPSFAVVEFDPGNSTIFPGSNTLAAPSSSASLTTSAAVATTGGTLLGNTKYFIKITYTTAAGETAGGTEGSVTTPVGTNTNSILLSLPALPANVTGENVYVGTATNAEKLNGSVASPSSVATNYYTITTPPGATASVPTTNTAGILTTPTAATFSTSSTGGTLPPSTTYYVKYTWYTANGETTPSTEQTVSTGATGTYTNSIVITAPAAPTGTTGMRVYIGTSSGQEVFSGSPAAVSSVVSNPYTFATANSIPASDTSGLSSPTLTAPTLAANAAGGSLAATTYYVEYTWASATGETIGSTQSSIATTGTTSFIGVTAPAAPTGATAMKVYVGTTSGKLIYNGSVVSPSTSGTNYYPIITPPLASKTPTLTVTPPATNTATLYSAPSVTFAPPTGGGTLAASTTYFVEYTYVNASGETTVSSESSFTTGPNTSTNEIPITLGTFPSGVTSAKVYVGTTSGGETLNGSTSTTSYTITSATGTTAAPLFNTTVNTTGSTSTQVPTNVQFSLINNPGAWNSATGATGNTPSGSFDVYLMPTYTVPVGPTALTFISSQGSGLPIGLQGQGGLSGVTTSNYLLGTFNAPGSAGPFTVNLTLPTGSAGATNAAATLTNDLNLNTKFELAIVPHTAGSYGEFEGEHEFNIQAGATVAANGVGGTPGTSAVDGALDESPKLSLTTTAASEAVTFPYAAVSVNQNNTSHVVEIDVNRTGYAGDSATVNYATTSSGGTAVAGTDYTTTSGTLSFAAGQTTAVISVPITGTSASDVTFKVTLTSPATGDSVPVSLGTSSTTITIIGTTNETENIGGSVSDIQGNNGFILGSSASSVQLVNATTSTYAAVNGDVNNGTDQFGTQQYAVMNFNASALQQLQSVTGLTSLTLELDNYNSNDGQFTDYTQSNGASGIAFPSRNPTHVGNFNVYLLNSSVTSVPTSGFAFEGQDVNGGGLGLTANPNTGGQGTPLLLGTASFSNQSTGNAQQTSLGEFGIQDTYTLDLSAAAQSALIADLNGWSTNSPGQVRLAVVAGSPSFAADFANNNSGTGGNFGIQPYLWFHGTSVAAALPPETFAINYKNVSVAANESVVAVDVSRAASSYTGDSATVNYTLGADYAALYPSEPTTGSITIPANQSSGTILIPLTPNPSATSQTTFSINLSSASPAGDTATPVVDTADATTVTVTPVLAATQTVAADNNGAAETNSTGLFTGYAYLNGSVTNGTGSFAFQGYQVLEFPPSLFVQPGQQLSSLTNISLGLGNYENQQGANYAGPPGNFNVYLAGDDESATEQNNNFAGSVASGGDPATYLTTASDGVGGFSPSPTPSATASGPLVATTEGTANTDDAIPLGTFSFNTELGLDYFTPSQAALSQTWTVANPVGGAPETVTPLTFMEQQINAGDNVRILAAPGNSAFHAYFWGANTGSNSGGPNGPHLAVVDAVTTNQTAESVSFPSASYNVDSNATGTVTIPVSRSLITNAGSGINDTMTVQYATADANAFAGTNYTSTSGTLTFAPGVATQFITVPIKQASLTGALSFTITLSSPATQAMSGYVTPVTGTNPTTTVFITDNANNAETLTQYDSSVGDVGTNGPVTFGASALNPAPPFNFSIFTGGRYSALDFNDSTVQNFDDPSEFNSATGPITVVGSPSMDANGNPNPNYTAPNNGIGPVVYAPTADGSLYSSTVGAINEISLSFVNYYNSTPGAKLNVYLVADATSNILPGALGTSKNPHYYDTSSTPDSNGYVGAADGVGTQFGSETLLGTIANPSTQSAVNFNGYTTVALTQFPVSAETTLMSDLNNGTKFRIIVAPKSSSTAPNADWIYGYINENDSYATATGTPINYYVQPELSFDVSDTSTNAALPAYITPSANADYVYDPSTGDLTVTNGTLTVDADVASDVTDQTIGQLNLTANGPTATIVLNTNQTPGSVTMQNGGMVSTLTAPTWLQPAGGALYGWDSLTHNLTIVSGTGTIVADPGSDEPNVIADGATSDLKIAPTTSDVDVHVNGIKLTNGAEVDMVSVGGRSHSNHNVLVIGTLGSAADPTISVDSTSKIDLEDNDMIVHTGSSDTGSIVTNGFGGYGENQPGGTELGIVQQLANTGRNIAPGGVFDGTWDGNGLTSSTAAAVDASQGFEQNILGVEMFSDMFLGGPLSGTPQWVVGNATESLGANDILVKYTYNGDLNLEGAVNGDAATIFSSFFNGQANAGNAGLPPANNENGFDSAYGDLNNDGNVDGNDATIFSSFFGNGLGGSQGATTTAGLL